jgi:competence protein ComEA
VSEDTPLDPLAALRAADARPFSEQLREKVAAHAFRLRPAASRIAGAAFVVALSAFGIWRFVTPSDPPLEDRLPLATPVAATASAIEVDVAPDDPERTAVVVHVAGAVTQPGLVVGSGDWRVADAIAAAGGSSTNADLDRVNLASPIADGERIYVPHVEESVLPVVVAGASSVAADDGGPINLNSATEADLDSLPGVGPATAAAIVTHRTEHGPFGSVDALLAVSGIGPAKLESIRDHVVVG